jgi:hypothetical protein
MDLAAIEERQLVGWRRRADPFVLDRIVMRRRLVDRHLQARRMIDGDRWVRRVRELLRAGGEHYAERNAPEHNLGLFHQSGVSGS